MGSLGAAVLQHRNNSCAAQEQPLHNRGTAIAQKRYNIGQLRSSSSSAQEQQLSSTETLAGQHSNNNYTAQEQLLEAQNISYTAQVQQ
jgi:hypothetical protein